jgi:hypothetical protein
MQPVIQPECSGMHAEAASKLPPSGLAAARLDGREGAVWAHPCLWYTLLATSPFLVCMCRVLLGADFLVPRLDHSRCHQQVLGST